MKWNLREKKYVTAGIRFCLKLFIPEKLPFHQCDLGIVLGNAIDNAIEAVKNCEPSDRTIDISMGVQKESFVFII